DVVLRSYAHVVERQEVEPVGARIIDLELGVVAFDAERAGPFSEVDRETAAQRNHIRSIGLEDIAIDSRTRLVHRIALQRGRGLSELQIEPGSVAASRIHIGCSLEDYGRLIQA